LCINYICVYPSAADCAYYWMSSGAPGLNVDTLPFGPWLGKYCGPVWNDASNVKESGFPDDIGKHNYFMFCNLTPNQQDWFKTWLNGNHYIANNFGGPYRDTLFRFATPGGATLANPSRGMWGWYRPECAKFGQFSKNTKLRTNMKFGPGFPYNDPSSVYQTQEEITQSRTYPLNATYGPWTGDITVPSLTSLEGADFYQVPLPEMFTKLTANLI